MTFGVGAIAQWAGYHPFIWLILVLCYITSCMVPWPLLGVIPMQSQDLSTANYSTKTNENINNKNLYDSGSIFISEIYTLVVCAGVGNNTHVYGQISWTTELWLSVFGVNMTWLTKLFLRWPGYSSLYCRKGKEEKWEWMGDLTYLEYLTCQITSLLVVAKKNVILVSSDLLC